MTKENPKPKKDSIVKNFKLTTAAINNRNTVLLLTMVLAIYGLITYIQLPKESFPDIKSQKYLSKPFTRVMLPLIWKILLPDLWKKNFIQ